MRDDSKQFRGIPIVRSGSKYQTAAGFAERELEENRYDTDYPRSLAQQANYEDSPYRMDSGYASGPF